MLTEAPVQNALSTLRDSPRFIKPRSPEALERAGVPEHLRSLDCLRTKSGAQPAALCLPEVKSVTTGGASPTVLRGLDAYLLAFLDSESERKSLVELASGYSVSLNFKTRDPGRQSARTAFQPEVLKDSSEVTLFGELPRPFAKHFFNRIYDERVSADASKSALFVIPFLATSLKGDTEVHSLNVYVRKHISGQRESTYKVTSQTNHMASSGLYEARAVTSDRIAATWQHLSTRFTSTGMLFGLDAREMTCHSHGSECITY